MKKKVHKISVTKPEIKLEGIYVRTNHKQALDKMKGNIFPCVRRNFHEMLPKKIPNQWKQGTTFCVYTNYESDYIDEELLR